MTAAMHGIKSIAFSQSYLQDYGLDFSPAKDYLSKAFNFVKDFDYNDIFYNINFPPLKGNEKISGIKMVQHGMKARKDVIKKKINDRNEEYFWLNVFVDHVPVDEDKIKTDIDAIANRYVSVTPLSVNFTNFNSFKSDDLKE